MGLPRSSSGPCYLCRGSVEDGENGTACSDCGAWVHDHCVERHGLVRSRGLVGAAEAECPSCGQVGRCGGPGWIEIARETGDATAGRGAATVRRRQRRR